MSEPRIFNLLVLLGLLLIALSSLTGCSCGDDDDDDDSADDDDASDDDDDQPDDDDDQPDDDDDNDDDEPISDCTGTELLCEDWEAYGIGDLPGAPWDPYLDGVATMSIVNDEKYLGNVVELTDTEELMASAALSWLHNAPFDSGMFTVEFDAYFMGGFFAMAVDRADTFSEAALYFKDSGPALFAADNNQVEYECGPMPLHTWAQIRVEIDLDVCTYSVFVNGDPGACLDLSGFVSANPCEVQGIAFYTGTLAGAARVDNIRVQP
jgi:hypothetical protein